MQWGWHPEVGAGKDCYDRGLIPTWLIIVGLIVEILLCVIIGYFLGIHHSKKKNLNAGSFTINYDDPTKELLAMKLNRDLPEIEAADYISLKVIVEGSFDSMSENSPGEIS